MIRNLIFDLGNVLISFKPSEFLKRKEYPENKINTILSDIFYGKEWAMLDNGDISTEQAIRSISGRSSLNIAETELIFNMRKEILYPIDDNVRLLPFLKKEGFGLYYLSNFPADLFEEVKNDYYFFRHFDGGLISAEARLSKPDIRFFELFIKKFCLAPEETLFIDDLPANVEAASVSGMKTYLTYGSDKIASEIFEILKIRN
ncbi:MAG: HAD family phosphatase [Bacteroidales bacterium]|jgi:putative hydrolase of the HAD superfamily|nr:HAD family phosphatase [Bacteroidales bacterium]